MSPPLKLNPIATANMARAYFAGMSPTELAKQYGVSTPYVLVAANRWDRRRKERLPKRAVPMMVPAAKPAQPVENHSTEPKIFQSSSGLMAYCEPEAREFSQIHTNLHE